MLFTTSLVPVLALCGLVSARTVEKRTSRTVSLYAYGGATNGAPVFYDNGMAYIGWQPESSTDTTATNITFTVDSSDTTVPWTIAANRTGQSNTTSPFSGSPMLYIVPTSGAFEQAGFVTNSSSAPTGAVTTGFAWFGTSVAYAASETDYQLMFTAVETGTDNLWKLYWNVNGTRYANSTAVTLKSTPPSRS
ncbi:hypothetical protein BP6252_04425 [Coleophoma cylindrospora]|uniref:DOMON domain-containing protein n=1 Tax=Coleophoma cylindrospora TaxID=1849047 RepID=A0A3D8S0F6_9HELO|nr:hypothetical protein BP6252_04425 [Coleophoma cylindrospora]